MSFIAALRKQVVLARISGIPVRADHRWFFVFGIMTLLIAASASQLGGDIGFLGGTAIGLSATLIFFLSIFLHEYAHAAVARIEGLEVIEIVLHPFGGLTRFRTEPETPKSEFRIAIAGPAASFVLSILFAGLGAIGSFASAPVLVIMGYALALLNFLIAVFNMLPGYPLDGGRVLRAYLWRSGRGIDEATILTGRFGQAIAGVLILIGLVFAIFRQELLTGSWAVLTGLFLYDSARNIIAEVGSMQRILVDDVMMLPITVAPATTLQKFVDTILSSYPATVFPVADRRRLHGLLMLKEMQAIPREKWNSLSVAEVMRPVDDTHFVPLGTPLAEARQTAGKNGAGLVGVIDHKGELVGIVHQKGRSR